MSRLSEKFKGKVKIGISSNKITFKIFKTTLVSKLINCVFPPYEDILPNNNTKIFEISVNKLNKAIDLVTAISNKKTMNLTFNIKKNKLILSTIDKINSSAKVEIPIVYSKNEITITFNSKYVIDIFKDMKSKKVTFKLHSNNTPILIEDISNFNCRFVIMPIQS